MKKPRNLSLIKIITCSCTQRVNKIEFLLFLSFFFNNKKITTLHLKICFYNIRLWYCTTFFISRILNYLHTLARAHIGMKNYSKILELHLLKSDINEIFITRLSLFF